MNFLQLNKYLNVKGGAEIVMKSISEVLSKNKQEVINVGFNLEKGELIEPSISLGVEKKKINRFFHDKKLVDKVIRIILDNDIEYVICHNVYHHFPLYQLFKAIKKRTNAKLILYLHDYKVVCPIHMLYNKSKTCEKCIDKRFYKVILNKCKDASLVKSTILGAESYYNNKLFDAYKYCDKIIAPSFFIREKVSSMGFKKDIEVLYNPVNIGNTSSDNKKTNTYGKNLLYLGRISEEKGISYLLKIAKLLPDINFSFIGTGPLEYLIKGSQLDNVKYLGYKSHKELPQIFKKTSFMISPIKWYEIFGLTIIESMALGIPVISTGMGGAKELLSDGRGVFIDKDDFYKAARQISEAFNMKEKEYEDLVVKGVNFSRDLSLDFYYTKLMEIL